MMLDHLGMTEAAREVEAAVAAVLAEGKVRTPDLGGTSSTEEVTDAVLEKLDLVAKEAAESTGGTPFWLRREF